MTRAEIERSPPRPRSRTAGILLATVAAAAAGGWLLAVDAADGAHDPPSALALALLVAAMLGLLVTSRCEAVSPPPEPVDCEVPAPRWTRALIFTAIAAVLTVAVLVRLPQLDRSDSYGPVTLEWVVAVVAWWAAVWQLAPPCSARARSPAPFQRRPWLAVAGVLVVALALRLVALESVPFTLSGDEANHGLEAAKILGGEIRSPFATSWLSMPTMFFFFQSVSLATFGQSILGIRFPSPWVGTAAVLVTFFLARRVAGHRAALATAVLVATYHFHIHYSRIGTNNVGDTLIVSAALLGAVRAMDGTRWRLLDWAATGTVCGLGLFTYPGARLAAIVVAAVWTLQLAVERRRRLRQRTVGIAISIATFLVVAAPMLQYAVRFPDEFHGRWNQVGIVPSGWLADETARTGSLAGEVLLDQLLRAGLAFSYYPDRRDLYGLDTPLLDPVTGALFLLGLGVGTASVLVRRCGLRLAPMVIWWWAAMVLGGMLTESPPSSQRLVTLAIPTCFFAVLGLRRLLGSVQAALMPRLPVDAVTFAAACVFGLWSVLFYFTDYTPRRIFGGAHAELATTIAPVFQDHRDSHDVVFLGPPFMYWGFPTMAYLAPDVTGSDVEAPLTAPPSSGWRAEGRGLFVVVLPPRIEELGFVRAAYPDGRVMETHSQGTAHGVLGAVYEVAPSGDSGSQRPDGFPR